MNSKCLIFKKFGKKIIAFYCNETWKGNGIQNFWQTVLHIDGMFSEGVTYNLTRELNATQYENTKM